MYPTILRAKDLSDVSKTILIVLEGHVSKATLDSLALLDSEELITKLVLWLQLDRHAEYLQSLLRFPSI